MERADIIKAIHSKTLRKLLTRCKGMKRPKKMRHSYIAKVVMCGPIGTEELLEILNAQKRAVIENKNLRMCCTKGVKRQKVLDVTLEPKTDVKATVKAAIE